MPSHRIHGRQFWWGRLRGYLALARISNSPTVLSNTLAGAALAGVLAPNGTVVLLAVAMVFFYTAGMFLNDLCDHTIDRHERPERPLPSGLVSRSEAVAAVAGLFGAGAAVLFYAGTGPFLSGLALIAVIVVYDLWHKSNPLSPLLMAGARVLVYVTTFLAFSTLPSGTLLISGGLLMLYVVGLTYVAKTENKPSATKYWPAAALFLPVVYFAFRLPPVAAMALLPLFAGWVAYSISFLYRPKSRDIGGAVGRLIAGISLYDGLVLVAAGSYIGAMLAVMTFLATLYLQRYVKGT
jgi:4-hydroxybenzoate polyprenyltransferase